MLFRKISYLQLNHKKQAIRKVPHVTRENIQFLHTFFLYQIHFLILNVTCVMRSHHDWNIIFYNLGVKFVLNVTKELHKQNSWKTTLPVRIFFMLERQMEVLLFLWSLILYFQHAKSPNELRLCLKEIKVKEVFLKSTLLVSQFLYLIKSTF